MEVITFVISGILFSALILSPILLFVRIRNTKSKWLIYLFWVVFITAGITLTSAWWTDYSYKLLLSHYGYDFDAMNEYDRYGKVISSNLDRVEQLHKSRLGIGWPLKALMFYAIYSPYLLVVYLGGSMLRKIRSQKSKSDLRE